MKFPLLLIAILFAPIVPSTAFAADAPPEISAARARYDAAAAAALKPVRERYIAELQQIKSRALFDKNANLAVAADEELKSLGVGGNFKQSLINSTWQWFQKETVTFLPNGKARWSVSGANSFSWKVVDDEKRKISGETAKHESFTIEFDAEMTTGTLTEGSNAQRQVKRIQAR